MGVTSAMVEKEFGGRNFGLDSEVKIKTILGGERDCCRMRVSSLRFLVVSPTLHCSYLSGNGAVGGVQAEESANDREVGTM